MTDEQQMRITRITILSALVLLLACVSACTYTCHSQREALVERIKAGEQPQCQQWSYPNTPE